MSEEETPRGQKLAHLWSTTFDEDLGEGAPGTFSVDDVVELARWAVEQHDRAEEAERIAKANWDLREFERQRAESLEVDRALLIQHLTETAKALGLAVERIHGSEVVQRMVEMLQKPLCKISPVVSRVCEHGTHGCLVSHKEGGRK